MKPAHSQRQPIAQQVESWLGMLRAVPVQNSAVTVRTEQNGNVTVLVQARKMWFLVPPLSWIIRPRLHKTYRLDQLGSQIWNFCDGQRDVEKIVDMFAEQHRLSFHEARVAVTEYIRGLMQKGAVAVQITSTAESKA